MFEDFSSPPHARDRRTLLISFSLHLLIIVSLLLLPLFYYRDLPEFVGRIILDAPPAPPAPPSPPPERAPAPSAAAPTARVVKTDAWVLPDAVPNSIPAPDLDLPAIETPSYGDFAGLPGGISGGSVPGAGGFGLGEGGLAPLPPPPPPPAVQKKPTRVGGLVQEAKRILRVDPVYPELARRARVQGIVLLEVLVSAEGAVEKVTIVRGHRLLREAAADAVRQWRYSPTLLNGEPVPVIATVTVRFTLN